MHRIWYSGDFLGADRVCFAAILLEDGVVSDLSLRNARRSSRVLSMDVEQYLAALGDDLREALRNDRLHELLTEALDSWSNNIQISDSEEIDAADRQAAESEMARAVSG